MATRLPIERFKLVAVDGPLGGGSGSGQSYQEAFVAGQFRRALGDGAYPSQADLVERLRGYDQAVMFALHFPPGGGVESEMDDVAPVGE